MPDMTLKELGAAHPGFKEYCRDLFVGNECDSDEYRETQPAKGLGYIADWATLSGVGTGYNRYEDWDPIMLRHIHAWLGAILATSDDDAPWVVAYAGSEELQPILRIYFDLLWEQGKHPYDHEPAELLEWFLQDQPA